MHVGGGTYEPTLLKEDILHYHQGFINHLKETDKFITDSFHSVLLGDEDSKYHDL